MYSADVRFGCLLKSLMLICILINCSAQKVDAAQAQVAWNASTDPAVIGYKVYYGTASRNYTASADARSSLTYQVTGLSDTQPQYFAVTAYSTNAESDFSEELACFTIKSTTPANGQVLPGGSIVLAQGSSQTFSIVPDSGFEIADVLVDGISVGPVSQYTFSNVGACHTVSAVFSSSSQKFSISASAQGSGTISPSGSLSVVSGASVTFAINPAQGYRTADVQVDSLSIGPVSSYTFSNVMKDHSISATFVPVIYTILSSAQSNGSISPSGSINVASGTNQTFTITPAANYQIADVQIDGSSIGVVQTYAFCNITANHSITATFAASSYTITSSAQKGGSISPSGSVAVNLNGNQTFNITPASGYKISDVLVDGASAGVVPIYSFANISADHAIQAFFAPASPPVADAGPDQVVQSGTETTLNGTNSTGLGSIVSYRWLQTDGPAVSLANPRSSICTFKAPQISDGTSLSFRLDVKDRSGATDSATCIINVSGTDNAPFANAGANQTVHAYSNVTLDGTGSSDPDDGIVSFQWVQTAGPTVSINNADTARATFSAPDSGTYGVSLVFQLTVTDHFGLKMRDYCTVNVSSGNQAPLAQAGQDKSINQMDTVSLDGTGSYSQTGTISYRWTQATGEPVTLSDPVSPQPSFTAPEQAAGVQPLVFRLTVTDDLGLSTSDKCEISVQGVTGPDLVGGWNSLSYNGKTLTCSLLVRNVGNQSTGSIAQIAYYLSNDGVDLTELISTAEIQSIEAGGSTTLSQKIPLTDARGKYIIAVLDAGSAVSEFSETNNRVARLVK